MSDVDRAILYGKLEEIEDQNKKKIAKLESKIDKKFTKLESKINELKADAGIRSDTTANVFHVCTQMLRKICNLVDEADFGSQHGIGCVFGQLRGTLFHQDQLDAVARERRVAFLAGALRPKPAKIAEFAPVHAVNLHSSYRLRGLEYRDLHRLQDSR